MPLFSPRKQYNSLDEELVLPPLRPTTILQPEHFSAPLQGLSYPVSYTHLTLPTTPYV